MSRSFDVEVGRSENMRRIKSFDTRPEVRLRCELWHRGIRYRKNYASVPGKPDIALVGLRIAVFVDGTFWHGHEWETKKMRLRHNADYWVQKIEGNMARDRAIDNELAEMDWLVLRFWDAEVRRALPHCMARIEQAIEDRRRGSTAHTAG